MDNKEELCRIFYIDIMFASYTYTKPDIEENSLKQELIRIKEESEILPIKKIKEKIENVNSNNLLWYQRFENRQFVNQKIKVENFIIEKEHNNLDGVINCAGKKIIDFLSENRSNLETSKRLKFILEYFEIVNKFLPIIVNQINENIFEVMSGNHRVMAQIEKGYSEIEAIVIKSNLILLQPQVPGQSLS